jgi:hypothetical protein
MLDRAVGIAGLALAIIGPVLGVVFPTLNRKVAWSGFILGILLLGVAGGIALFPGGAAQTSSPNQPPTVNQGPGSAYSYGQQGGITAGTINIGPGRLAFSSQLGNELLAKMPAKKQVLIRSVGGAADQNVANEIQAFLDQNGYEIQRMSFGMLIPPPDWPITLMDSPKKYTLTIAPSAH